MLNIKPRAQATQAQEEQPQAAVIRRSSSASNHRPVSGKSTSTFVKATGEYRRRLVVNIEGEEKSGKDHTALTMDGPVYVHSFDIGLEGVVEKFQNSKSIYICEYELAVQPGEGTPDEISDSADKVWQQFIANYRDSLASTRKEGGVVLDTGTEMWELLRLARFGKLTQIMPHHYGPVNTEFNGLVREAYDGNNVAFLHKLMDEWENYTEGGREKGRKTGRKARKGFSNMPFLVQANVRCNREDQEGGGSQFTITVEDCRQNPTVNGLTIDNDFPTLLEMVFS